MFSLCHNIKNNNKKNKKKNKNPHQNLSERGVEEVCNLTYKLLMGFCLRLEGEGSEGPMSQEEVEKQKEPHQIYNKGAY